MIRYIYPYIITYIHLYTLLVNHNYILIKCTSFFISIISILHYNMEQCMVYSISLRIEKLKKQQLPFVARISHEFKRRIQSLCMTSLSRQYKSQFQYKQSICKNYEKMLALGPTNKKYLVYEIQKYLKIATIITFLQCPLPLQQSML